MFHVTPVLADTSALTLSTMGERVTLLRPGVATVGPYGETVAGVTVSVATVAARVRPQSAPERIEADRLTGGNTYTVRVARDAFTVPVDATYALRWERAVDRGGPLVLAVTAVVDDHARGRFFDFLATSRSPVPA